MKRIVTLMIAAAMVCSMVVPAFAVETKVSGHFQYAMVGMDRDAVKSGAGTQTDRFWMTQRSRIVLSFVASENLKGVVRFTTGNAQWGDNANFAGLDNSTPMSLDRAYVDWNIANTSLNMKIGKQVITLPWAVAGNPVMDSTVAGIVLSSKINDNVSLTGLWARPSNTAGAAHNSVDAFAAIADIKAGMVSLKPWAMYGSIGAEAGLNENGTALAADSRGYAYWLGAAATFQITNEFAVKADAIYGAVDGFGRNAAGVDYEQKGWLAAVKAEYKMAWGTPSLTGWYGSGNSRNKDRQMPSLLNGDSNWGWHATSFGFFKHDALTQGHIFGNGTAGTAAIVAAIEDISFAKDLSHAVRVMYLVGTDNKNNTGASGMWALNRDGSAIQDFSKDDSAIEVNWDSRYKISDNLRMSLDLAYIYVDFDHRVTNEQNKFWRTGLGFYYDF